MVNIVFTITLLQTLKIFNLNFFFLDQIKFYNFFLAIVIKLYITQLANNLIQYKTNYTNTIQLYKMKMFIMHKFSVINKKKKCTLVLLVHYYNYFYNPHIKTRQGSFTSDTTYL